MATENVPSGTATTDTAAPGPSKSTGVVGGGAGLAAGAGDAVTATAVLKAEAAADSRKWRQNAAGAWVIATDSPPKQEEETEVDTGDVVSVYMLQTGKVLSIPVGPTETGGTLKAKVCSKQGLAENTVTLLFNGGELSESLPIARILAGGAKVALLLSGLELIFDPSTKTEHVTLSDNCKEMSARNASNYCSETNTVRVKTPFPGSGVFEFVMQSTGRDSGCYDCIGLATEDFDMDQGVGADDNGWCFRTCYGEKRHGGNTEYIGELGYIPPRTMMKCVLDRGAGTWTMARTKNAEGDWGEYITIYDNIPGGVPLYLVCTVCGHDGQAKLRIIDDDSKPISTNSADGWEDV